MIDREENSCPSCGYPSRAGHSPDCTAQTEADMASVIEPVAETKENRAAGLYKHERTLGERLRGRAREVALALALVTTSLVGGKEDQAFEIRSSSEATAALQEKGMELSGERLKFNDGHTLKLNSDGQTKKVWVQVIEGRGTHPSRIRITVENNDGSTDLIESSDGTKETTTIDHTTPAKE